MSAVFSVLALIISLAIDFFLSPYIVENIGVEANGYVQMANNLISIASLATIALNSMGARTIAIHFYKDEFDECKKYYSSLIVGNIVLSIILLIPAIICAWKINYIFDIVNISVFDAKVLFLFAFLNFFVSQFVSLFNISTFVKNQQYLSSLANIVIVLFKIAFYFLFFYVFSAKVYVVTLVAFISNLLQTILVFVVKKHVLSEICFSFDHVSFNCIFHLFKFGFWNSLNQSGNILMTGLDLMIANWFINPTLMGVLSVAKIVPNIIVTLSTTLNNSVLSHQTIIYAMETNEEFVKKLEFYIKISMLAVSLPVCIFLVFSLRFYDLWQPTLDSKTLSLLSFLSLLALIPLSGVQILYNVLTCMNKLKVNAISFLVTGVVNVLLVLVLTKYMSLSVFAVAGVSSILSILRMTIVMLPYISKILKQKRTYFYKYILKSLILFLMISAISVPFALIPLNGWIPFVFGVFFSFVISLFGCYILVFSQEEKKFFKAYFTERLSK